MSNATLTKGEWHKVEYHGYLSPSGEKEVMRVWVDGVESDPSLRFTGMTIGPIWGGSPMTRWDRTGRIHKVTDLRTGKVEWDRTRDWAYLDTRFSPATDTFRCSGCGGPNPPHHTVQGPGGRPMSVCPKCIELGERISLI